MNRPKIKDYKNLTKKNGLCVLKTDTEKYINDLERYCDELEHNYDRALSDVVKYTMALNKACRRLAKYDQIIYGDEEPCDAQDYYEWSFEDD